MVLRPGSFIDNYLNGHRVGYQTPINYLMIAFALLVFLMTFYINDLTVNFVEASAIAEVNDKVKQLAQKASEIVATQANFFLFFMPLCLGFVMSKGEKRPSGDFYFASSFIVATSIFILSPLYVALIWFPSIVKIKLALNLMYLCFAFYQFIKPSGLMHTVGLFIKVVLGWGLYMLLVMTFVLVQLLISPLLS